MTSQTRQMKVGDYRVTYRPFTVGEVKGIDEVGGEIDDFLWDSVIQEVTLNGEVIPIDALDFHHFKDIGAAVFLGVPPNGRAGSSKRQ